MPRSCNSTGIGNDKDVDLGKIQNYQNSSQTSKMTKSKNPQKLIK
jgi:hypothetical protein